jgi:aldehyde dehydrogenase (NAD+)
MKNMVGSLMSNLGVNLSRFSEGNIPVRTPITGEEIGKVSECDELDYRIKISNAVIAFNKWKDVPAPKRGELVRIFGNSLRENKEDLARLVTIENGKILSESRGEVQEMIDICDFAVGLSRQLYGLTIQSERKDHVMQESWFPLGPVGVITAFNFPVAVWSWNAAIALVCGDSIVWKPSPKTPLTALACHALLSGAAHTLDYVPEFLNQVIIGQEKQGKMIADDNNIPLVSATGSVIMGKEISRRVAGRFGRSLLELGGNNAVVVCKSADQDIALPSILFGAIGTAGQRCTSTRRVFIHTDIYESFSGKLKAAYSGLAAKVGNPLEKNTLIGPLIDEQAYVNMQNALSVARNSGGIVFQGERISVSGNQSFYVNPALVEMPLHEGIVHTETFAPVLYLFRFENLDDVMAKHNEVPQGLSSAVFTRDICEAEDFKRLSDCGIANVNIGTSGAEIGGAFGGEKETGGGRESGSDAWKAYMRRQTSTTYYGSQKPELAQGISFE